MTTATNKEQTKRTNQKNTPKEPQKRRAPKGPESNFPIPDNPHFLFGKDLTPDSLPYTILLIQPGLGVTLGVH